MFVSFFPWFFMVSFLGFLVGVCGGVVFSFFLFLNALKGGFLWFGFSWFYPRLVVEKPFALPKKCLIFLVFLGHVHPRQETKAWPSEPPNRPGDRSYIHKAPGGAESSFPGKTR